MIKAGINSGGGDGGGDGGVVVVVAAALLTALQLLLQLGYLLEDTRMWTGGDTPELYWSALPQDAERWSKFGERSSGELRFLSGGESLCLATSLPSEPPCPAGLATSGGGGGSGWVVGLTGLEQ
ncbi:hypothetical protein CRUP_022090 [Coryphaenoides rupestris]|nr:hypothetical protein CRUP_022090 [Coryphaenoides rupestris]